MNEITHGFFRNTLRSMEGSWVRPRLVGWPDFQFDTSQVIHEALVRGEYLPSDWAKLQGYRDALMERAES